LAVNGEIGTVGGTREMGSSWRYPGDLEQLAVPGRSGAVGGQPEDPEQVAVASGDPEPPEVRRGQSSYNVVRE
jgi:hypothetical protein